MPSAPSEYAVNTMKHIYLNDCGAGVLESVTGNCQLSIVRYANAILASGYTLKQQKEYFIKLRQAVATPLLLIDINRGCCESVEKLFDANQIIMRNDYTSSNQSEMTIYILRVPYSLTGKY